MKKEDATLSNTELRRQAEDKLTNLKQRTAEFPKSDADIQRLVHELQVHQIELEMQNEELVQARIQLESTLSMYVELYAFAPVGYFTLARDGTIRHANLTGTKLIGVGLSELIGRHFDIFISTESRTTFRIFLDKVFKSQNKERCNVALQKNQAEPVWVYMVGICESSGAESGICYMIVSEITASNQTKDVLSLES